MKKIISLLMAITLILLQCITVSAEGDVSIDMLEKSSIVTSISEMDGKYKTQGRTTVLDGVLMLDWSAATFEFNANCEGNVYVDFYTKSLSSGSCYFTVYVDGAKSERDAFIITAKGDTRFQIATDLKSGDHTFKIVRQTEIERAQTGIVSVELCGTFLDPPEEKDLYIEFVGASTTAGYGNLGDSSVSNSDAPKPQYQDVTQAFSYMTAEELDADYSIVARQGTGATVGYQPTSMVDVYPLLRHCYDSSTPYDFSRTADIVVVGLGTNDANTYNNSTYNGGTNMTLDDVEAGFVEMLEIIRENNPNAKIIWMYNMMTSGINSQVLGAVETAGGAENGFYALKVTKNNDGAKNHPSAEGHKVFTEELTEFIRNTLCIKTGNFKGNSVRLTGNPALRFRYTFLKSSLEENAIGDGETISKIGFVVANSTKINNGDFVLGDADTFEGIAYDRAEGINIISEEDTDTVTYQAALYNIGAFMYSDQTNYNVLGQGYYVRIYYVLTSSSGTRTVYDTARLCSFFDVVKAIESVGSGDDYDNLFASDGYMQSETLDTINNQTINNAYNSWNR